MFRVVLLFFLCSWKPDESMATRAPWVELRDGNSMPSLAFGTGRSTALEKEPKDIVRQAVLTALQAGYRHIDTASIYNDEEQVGLGIADAISKGFVKRHQLFVTTKLWNDRHNRKDVVPALEESLKRLKLDYVDLYLINYPMSIKANGTPENIDYLETWKGMEDARLEGLTLSIGVSNFNKQQLDRLVANSVKPPVVNQIEVNPTLTQIPLVEHCQYRRIVVMAYCPFGFLVDRHEINTPPPKPDDPILVEIAAKYQKSTGQIVLRYLIDRGITPIPKSTNKERIEQNIDIFDFKLTPKEIEKIGNFNKDIRVIPKKEWQTFPNYPFEKN